jgi:gluconokinase
VKRDSLFIVMGVSGCGKTTIARLLAEKIGSRWLDADDFHTPEKKAKMHSGIPLTDDDRWPWLDRLNAELRTIAAKGETVFLACSALKQRYRDRLTTGLSGARFVYLKCPPELIRARLLHRKGHFMPSSLLDSQFAELEEPHDALVLDGARTPEDIVRQFLELTSPVRE